MALLFEWDPRKASRNLHIHGVSFDSKQTIGSGSHRARTSDSHYQCEIREPKGETRT